MNANNTADVANAIGATMNLRINVNVFIVLRINVFIVIYVFLYINTS